jgi:uncharacterized membrane protein (UPF0136 family)
MLTIVGHVTLAVYAILLAVGGVIGFVKARSHASLIAGLVSALAAVAAMVLSIQGYWFGVALGSTLAIGLFVFFGYRYALTHRFMPAGMMAIVSFLVLAVMFALIMFADEQIPISG